MIARKSFIVTTAILDAVLIGSALVQLANTAAPKSTLTATFSVGVIAFSAVCAAVLVWWRERAAFAANLALAGVAFAVACFVVSVPGLVSLLIACYAAARFGADRIKTFLVALVCAAAAAIGGLLGQIPSPSVVMIELALGMAVLLGLWRQAVVEKRFETQELQRQLLVSEAVSKERARIAADLHDSVAHSLAVVTVQAQGASRIVLTDPQRAKSALEAISDASRQAQREIRVTLGQLDGEALDAVEGIDAAVAAATAAGLTVSLGNVEAISQLEPTQQLLCYRTVQESLTNAIKHSGTESVVTVETAEDGRWFVLLTECAHRSQTSVGSGPADNAVGGRGLAGLARRANELGGTLEVTDSTYSFRVQLRLPRRSGA